MEKDRRIKGCGGGTFFFLKNGGGTVDVFLFFWNKQAWDCAYFIDKEDKEELLKFSGNSGSLRIDFMRC